MAGRGKPSYLSIDRQSRCCRSEGKPRGSWNEALGWKAFSAQQPQWKVNRPMKSPLSLYPRLQGAITHQSVI
jgi:hypothetical protein